MSQVTGILLLSLFLIFILGRYGWKVLGFSICDGSVIEVLEVSENEVDIKGYDPSLLPKGYVGYIQKIEDDKLYIGIHYSSVFGFFETSSFEERIPVSSQIHEIYLKVKGNEYLIWPK